MPDRWDWVLDPERADEKRKDEKIVAELRMLADAQAAQSICPSCDAWATCPKGSVAQGIYKGEPIRTCPWHPRGPPRPDGVPTSYFEMPSHVVITPIPGGRRRLS